MKETHTLSRADKSVTLKNLDAFKDLIECYTVADLRSMVYDIPIKKSGGCCYPAVQTLFSLMEMLGKLLRQNTSTRGVGAFTLVFTRLGRQYNDEDLARRLYNYFRHGIAHNSLARAGVSVKKSGDRTFHLSDNGNNIDVRVLFEDFEPFFYESFDTTLRNPSHISQYEQNLRDVFTELQIPWQQQYQVAEGDLDLSANYTRTTTSGTRLPKTPSSGASVTQLSTGESRTQLRNAKKKSQRPRRTWLE